MLSRHAELALRMSRVLNHALAPAMVIASISSRSAEYARTEPTNCSAALGHRSAPFIETRIDQQRAWPGIRAGVHRASASTRSWRRGMPERQPPGNRSNSPRALAKRMRSTHASRPATIAATARALPSAVLGPVGRPPCQRKRRRPGDRSLARRLYAPRKLHVIFDHATVFWSVDGVGGMGHLTRLIDPAQFR